MQVGLSGTPEEVVSKSLFGFSHDEKRFVEIAMETKSTFRVKLEMPVPKRILGMPLSTLCQKEIKIEGIERLHEITTQYFDMNLDDFRQYFSKKTWLPSFFSSPTAAHGFDSNALLRLCELHRYTY